MAAHGMTAVDSTLGDESVVTASAPGKLFLLGEYAVLHGAPALLTAVDRRARVTIGTAARDFTVTAPNLGLNAQLNADGSLPDDLGAGEKDQLRVFTAVRETLIDDGLLPTLPALAVSIDSSPFWATGAGKLGLGSSAAVAVALTSALTRAAGVRLERDRLCEVAIRAHRASQGGTGSGGDVAASVYGGLIGYTSGRPVEPLNWPKDVTMLVVVTGTGSSTPDLVARVKEYGEQDPEQHHADLERLAGLAAQAPHALASAEEFLDLASRYFDALDQLDSHSGAGIITQRHRELRQIAAESGAVFKSSGAGGGDVGLVFCNGPLQAKRALEALTEAGAQVLPLGLAAAGVQDGVSP